ncbi:hypothetical protein [Nocardia arthritidis]|uniref:Uncharacterized protein n=1 Tax=Nocardia arthritidis TaxID=228602 RepID=A0A6G9Y934_9NOCA|nr:hypothetical protein [Nocardia arthritidis]QIS09732.1 hypothetical protein F5544_09155 [Nocardia arthritidis]
MEHYVRREPIPAVGGTLVSVRLPVRARLRGWLTDLRYWNPLGDRMFTISTYTSVSQRLPDGTNGPIIAPRGGGAESSGC